jgi:hypothetical protein
MQNVRKIIGSGGDWPAQLESALKTGVHAPTITGVPLIPAAGLAATPDQSRPQPIGTSQDYDDWWRQLQDQRFVFGP